MATFGPTFPGTGANDATTGTLPWSTPGSITSDDSSYAQVSFDTTAVTQYLKATNFSGITGIPGNAVISQIDVDVRRWQSIASPAAQDASARIVKADGSIYATDKAAAGVNWPTSEATKTYTWLAADLSGFTGANVNTSSFGFVLSVNMGDAGGPTQTLNVDWIKVTITYTTAGGQRRTMRGAWRGVTR